MLSVPILCLLLLGKKLKKRKALLAGYRPNLLCRRRARHCRRQFLTNIQTLIHTESEKISLPQCRRSRQVTKGEDNPKVLKTDKDFGAVPHLKSDLMNAPITVGVNAAVTIKIRAANGKDYRSLKSGSLKDVIVICNYSITPLPPPA